MIQCTQEEIAGFLDLSVDTLQRDKKFCGIYETKKKTGKMSLRRKQYELAMSGDKTLLIWLGKQYLEQSDKQGIEHSGLIETTAVINIKPIQKNGNDTKKST